MKFFFKQMLKVSVFYLEKQKSLIPKKKCFGRCQYQNKKALFTDPNFSEGFALACLPLQGSRGALGDRLESRARAQLCLLCTTAAL